MNIASSSSTTNTGDLDELAVWETSFFVSSALLPARRGRGLGRGLGRPGPGAGADIGRRSTVEVEMLKRVSLITRTRAKAAPRLSRGKELETRPQRI